MLDQVHNPDDLKKLSDSQLPILAEKIRKRIIDSVSQNGGHLASNLGAVELSIALHRVFTSPTDALVWDVGHQSYTHKILTGRNADFMSLRQKDGLSGFTKRKESIHDVFDSGHSSTSISAALGLLAGKSLLHVDGHVVAILGDGSLTGGMALEALSHAGQINKNVIVVLNDNQMSIGKNTGSISTHLSKLTTTPSYQTFRYTVDTIVSRLPVFSTQLTNAIFRLKRGIKGVFFKTNLFTDFGFEYVGPIDGHNIKELEHVFTQVKQINKPVVVHVVTQKGRGYTHAENDPMFFHGVAPFSIIDGKVEKSTSKSFTESFSNSVVELAKDNDKIVCITAAMEKGTGLSDFANSYPERFFDVGIAEQHAVTFASGLSAAGMRPIVAIYSTFLQRSIDQIIHDVALQNLPVIFALDRSGIVPDDGETHQGVFDIALLRTIPHMTILAPTSSLELHSSLEWALNQSGPVALRYPKESTPEENDSFTEEFVVGRGVLVQKNAYATHLFVCTGSMYPQCFEATKILQEQAIICDIYSLRFIKPIDIDYFLSLVATYTTIIFVEDGMEYGGVSELLEKEVKKNYPQKNTIIKAVPDAFLAQGKRLEILDVIGLSAKKLLENW